MIKVELANESALRGLDLPKNIRSQVSRAIRATLKDAKKAAGQKIASRYTIAAGTVTRTIKYTVSGFSGKMTSSGRRNLIRKFLLRPRRWTRKKPAGGLFVQNVKGQGGMLPHAWVSKSGLVFERAGRSRLPIEHKTAPSAPGMLGNPIVGPFIEAKMFDRLKVNLDGIF